jgi:HEPN domain-containing protein
MYSIQQYVIKYVSGFLRFPPPKITDSHDITEILLNVALNTREREREREYILYYNVISRKKHKSHENDFKRSLLIYKINFISVI